MPVAGSQPVHHLHRWQEDVASSDIPRSDPISDQRPFGRVLLQAPDNISETPLPFLPMLLTRPASCVTTDVHVDQDTNRPSDGCGHGCRFGVTSAAGQPGAEDGSFGGAQGPAAQGSSSARGSPWPRPSVSPAPSPASHPPAANHISTDKQSGLLRRMCTPALHRYSCHKLEDKQILRVVSWLVFRAFSMALHTKATRTPPPLPSFRVRKPEVMLLCCAAGELAGRSSGGK